MRNSLPNYIVKYIVYLRESLGKLNNNIATIISVRKINYFVISIFKKFENYRFKKFKCLGKIKLNIRRSSTSILKMMILKYSSDLK